MPLGGNVARDVDPLRIANRFVGMEQSGIRQMADAAIKHPNAIRLEGGQPNFPVAPHIALAAKLAVDEGWNAYTPSAGIDELRELIAQKLARVNGIRATAEQIICTSGGTGAIAASFLCTLQEGDEVLIPDPSWPIYAMLARLAGAQVIRYQCSAADRFEPDIDALERLITPRCRMLVINSPNNPSGAVYSRPTLESMLDIARRHDVWVLSDECYDELVFESSAQSVAPLLEDDRVISVYSFSKTYSMTGWRLGYIVAAQRLVPSLIRAQQCLTLCVSSISQRAGEAALVGPQDVVGEMRSAYRRRRDFATGVLHDAGLLMNVPLGAFYILANIAATGLDSSQFASDLLRERGVAVSPGIAFGSTLKNAVRISLASNDADLREGLVRLCSFGSDLIASRRN